MDSMQNNKLFEGDIIGVPVDEDPSMFLEKKMRDQPLNDDFDEIFKRPVGFFTFYLFKDNYF